MLFIIQKPLWVNLKGFSLGFLVEGTIAVDLGPPTFLGFASWMLGNKIQHILPNDALTLLIGSMYGIFTLGYMYSIWYIIIIIYLHLVGLLW